MHAEEGVYHGAEVHVNLWRPLVEDREEFSLAQMWLLAEGETEDDLNTIEVGWQAYPKLYGDDIPRFFVFWTPDNYRTGCHNLLCHGFVQTTEHYGVGTSFQYFSAYGGMQYLMTVKVEKDPVSGDWWLTFNGEKIGFWPKGIFTNMQEHAGLVNLKRGGQHTATAMGNGHFGEEGYSKSCYMSHIAVINDQHVRNGEPRIADIDVDNEKCYNLVLSVDENQGTHIYFGGPGRSPDCP
ncbi:PREDICTED: uncharacterized protein LOC104811324 [Tarenaya hassleriana]|uniref:uncharacterized protein LOC104811324 n=1 Tax=Tarenaya hassleriana TaxID=28532 RepID=UPI00053C1B4D|nr:PREDICTED: uncharacterized protein LOC104811324 [Tarenaya hassleriana]